VFVSPEVSTHAAFPASKTVNTVYIYIYIVNLQQKYNTNTNYYLRKKRTFEILRRKTKRFANSFVMACTKSMTCSWLVKFFCSMFFFASRKESVCNYYKLLGILRFDNIVKLRLATFANRLSNDLSFKCTRDISWLPYTNIKCSQSQYKIVSQK
jgi:hypothetical protein